MTFVLFFWFWLHLLWLSSVLFVFLKISSFQSFFAAESYYIFLLHSPLQKYCACLLGCLLQIHTWLHVPFASLASSPNTLQCGSMGFFMSVYFYHVKGFHTSLQGPSPFPCHRHHYRILFWTLILWRFFTTAFRSGAKSCFVEGVTCMSVVIHKVYNFSWTLFLKNSMSCITLEIFLIVSPVFVIFNLFPLKFEVQVSFRAQRPWNMKSPWTMVLILFFRKRAQGDRRSSCSLLLLWCLGFEARCYWL